MRLLWLPTVLRAAGLTVHEVSGWKTRGADSYGPVRGITVHHTAGSRTSTIQGEINVLLNGSATAPPPIAQLLLARTGDWYVVASGLCYHNLIGWGGPNEGYGNDSLLGIEAQHSGGTEPWTDVQYRSYVRGVAALVAHQASGYDVTVSRVAGHKEHQPGDKSDPTFNMSTFRADVARVLAGEDGFLMALSDQQQRHAYLMLHNLESLLVHLCAGAEQRAQFTSKSASFAFPAQTIAPNRWLRELLGGQVTDAELQAKVTELLTAVDQVDDKVLAGLGGTDAEVAEALTAVLGAEKAAAVGRLLIEAPAT